MCYVKASESRAQEKAVIARPTTEVYFRGSKFWQAKKLKVKHNIRLISYKS